MQTPVQKLIIIKKKKDKISEVSPISPEVLRWSKVRKIKLE